MSGIQWENITECIKEGQTAWIQNYKKIDLKLIYGKYEIQIETKRLVS